MSDALFDVPDPLSEDGSGPSAHARDRTPSRARSRAPLAVRMRPRTLDEMARVNGVGAKKLESYGMDFLQVIAGDVAPLHPAR